MLDLARIRAAEVSDKPYPFFTVEQAIRPDLAEKVAADFPKIDRAGVVSPSETKPGPAFAALLDELQGDAFRSVIAEKFATWRRLWKECGHAGPMPRTFLTRHVHVAETDEQAKAEAAAHLATPRVADPVFRGAGQEVMARSGMGYGADGRYAGEAIARHVAQSS